MNKIRTLFNRIRLDQRLMELDKRSPMASLILASVTAGLGYVLLALLPLLTLTGIFKIIGGIGSASTLGAWLDLFIWLLITAACAIASYTQLRLKINMPSGLGLKQDKAPKIYELLEELSENYQAPQIHRLVIHEKFSLELIPVPRFGIPLLTTNILYIGLPVLQGLSPHEFHGALARIIGQFSGEQSKKSHWVYRCVQFFQLYQRASRKSHSAIFRPLQFFYRIYTPLLEYCSAATLRQDELEADVYMLDIMNDTEVADVILRYEVSTVFLKHKYWPKIHAMLRKEPAKPSYLPHINMAKVMRNALTENEFAQTMKQLLDLEPSWQDSKPTLITRLENIGQTKLNIPPPVMETAAQRYLGEAYGAVIKLLDKQWLSKHGKSSSKARKTAASSSSSDPDMEDPTILTEAETESGQRQTVPQKKKSSTHEPPVNAAQTPLEDNNSTVTVADRKRLAELKQKAEFAELSDDETWEFAHLTEKLEDKPNAIGLYQRVLKRNPNHAKTLFAIGRILIGKMDASGVKALERAMELDKGCIAQSCWMLAKYYKSIGDEACSKQYLERAASISVAA